MKDPKVGFNAKSQSPNRRPKQKTVAITSRDLERLRTPYPNGKPPRWHFSKSDTPSWEEIRCAICKTPFMGRRSAHRVCCSKPCTARHASKIRLAKFGRGL